jgi:hypothetical protein
MRLIIKVKKEEKLYFIDYDESCPSTFRGERARRGRRTNIREEKRRKKLAASSSFIHRARLLLNTNRELPTSLLPPEAALCSLLSQWRVEAKLFMAQKLFNTSHDLISVIERLAHPELNPGLASSI